MKIEKCIKRTVYSIIIDGGKTDITITHSSSSKGELITCRGLKVPPTINFPEMYENIEKALIKREGEDNEYGFKVSKNIRMGSTIKKEFF